MKHISLLCISFLVLTACTSSQKISSRSPVAIDVVKGLDLSNLMAGGLEPVSFSFADSLYDTYRDKFKGKLERNWISTNNNIPKAGKQSKHIWISYDELKAFMRSLENVEKEMKRNNNLDVSGVRIYFGAYPKGMKDEAFRKKLSVILCGTYKKGNRQVDIVAENKNGKREIAGYHNHGHLCPPDNCDGALLDER